VMTLAVQTLLRRSSEGRFGLGILVAIAAAAGDRGLALFQRGEAAIRTGAVGEVRAPRIILRMGGSPDRTRSSKDRRQEQKPHHSPTIWQFRSGNFWLMIRIRTSCGHDALAAAGATVSPRPAADRYY
jgi:hypothetical protein